jgi:hypothetical protein
MSGGKRLDDHSNWMGGPSKGSVFPEGVKIKHEFSANGAGELNMYEDSSEAVKNAQEMGQGKVKSHSPKSNYRH